MGNSARPKTISADAGGGFGGGIRRAVTNFGGYKRANSQIKNKVELVLYKDEKLTKQIKIILLGHYIFYYKNNKREKKKDMKKRNQKKGKIKMRMIMFQWEIPQDLKQ